MNKRHLFVATAAVALLSAGAAGSAQAAETPSAIEQAESGIAEIIVTAQRRAENMQDVPIAITAFSAAALTQKGMRDSRDLEISTPSLSFGNQFGAPSSAVINIRGQVQADTVITVDPSVGVYFDDIYLGRANGQLTELFDVERVEVLKGPQGTLYGRNTTGGALKVITKKADPSAPAGGYVSLSYGRFNYLAAEAGVNLPIIEDKLAIRVSGTSRIQDGWTKTIVTDGGSIGVAAKPTGQVVDTNDKNFKSVRGSLVAKPSNAFTLTLAADYTKNNTNGILTRNNLGDVFSGNVFNPANRGFSFSPEGSDFRVGRSHLVPFANLSQWGVSGTAEWDLGAAVAKLILAHRKVDVKHRSDVDGSDAFLLDYTYTMDMKQDSAELQLTGDAIDGRLHWLVGGFWFDEKGSERTDSFAFYGLDYRVSASNARNKSKSVFSHLVFDITDRLSATLGARYTWDSKGIDNNSRLNNFCPFKPPQEGLVVRSPTDCTLSRNAKTSFESWAVGLDYKVSQDVLVYVKSGRASRSGGQQARGYGFDPAAVNPFDGTIGFDSSAAFTPETLTDVEIGLKSLFLDRKLKFNIDYYHSWVKDQQQSTIVPLTLSPGLTTTFIANLPGTTQVDGVEVESTLKLGQLTLDASGSYTKVKESDPAHFIPVLSPKWKVSATATYDVPVSYGTYSASVTYGYTDAQFANANPIFASLVRLGNRSVVNARVGLNFKNGLNVAFWGKNVFNEKYYNFNTAFAPLGLTINPSFEGAPREFGLTVGGTF